MRRSARLSEKSAKLDNEAHEEPNTKKNRWYKKQSNIAQLDNGTMVEAFKFHNYCQLAKNSLVSKRFRNVIQAHRHKMALLYVNSISMDSTPFFHAHIRVFGKVLSTEAYNEWIIRNNCSKQAPIKQFQSNSYQLMAYAYYKDPYHRELQDRITVLYARVALNHKTMPLFQHFIRLLTDPFVYIRCMAFTAQKDAFNLLDAAIDPNRGRLQCEILTFDFECKFLTFFNWIKDHVRCAKFQLAVPNSSTNRDKHLLDFFGTGSHCASEIVVTNCYISKAIVIDFVQKFLNLKSCDENHIVHLIRGTVIKPTAEALKSNYIKFFVQEEEDGWNTEHIFEFANAEIGKKMRLAVSNANTHQVTLEIINL